MVVEYLHWVRIRPAPAAYPMTKSPSESPSPPFQELIQRLVDGLDRVAQALDCPVAGLRQREVAALKGVEHDAAQVHARDIPVDAWRCDPGV